MQPKIGDVRGLFCHEPFLQYDISYERYTSDCDVGVCMSQL